MSIGLVISILMHAALLGFALVSIAGTQPRELRTPAPEPIIADVISASELNQMRKGVREAKLDEAQPKDVPKPDEATKETPKPRPVAKPPPAAEPPPPEPETPVEAAKEEPPPPPPAKAEPPPAPAPKPEPDKAALDQKLEELALQKAEEEKVRQEAEAKAKAEAEAKAKAEEELRKEEARRKLAEQKRLEAKRKEEERKKALEKRKKELAEKRKREAEKRKAELAKQKHLDTGRLSALLDKTPDPKQAPAANDAPSKPTAAKGPVRGDVHGRDATISANEASFLAGLMRQAVSRCWNINAGLDGIQQMVVKVEVRLSPQGEIVGQPKVVNPQASPVFRDAADSAVRALVQCAPYTLPPDKYAGGWEYMVLTFDPARMF